MITTRRTPVGCCVRCSVAKLRLAHWTETTLRFDLSLLGQTESDVAWQVLGPAQTQGEGRYRRK